MNNFHPQYVDYLCENKYLTIKYLRGYVRVTSVASNVSNNVPDIVLGHSGHQQSSTFGHQALVLDLESAESECQRQNTHQVSEEDPSVVFSKSKKNK